MHPFKSAVAILLVSAVVSAQAPPPAPQQPTPPPPGPAAQAAPPAPAAPMGALNLQNASLTEVIDQLARYLHLNVIVDPSVKGGVTLNTYGDPRNLDARNLLDEILRINGFGMTEAGGIYRIIPLNDLQHQPLPPQRFHNRLRHRISRQDFPHSRNRDGSQFRAFIALRHQEAAASSGRSRKNPSTDRAKAVLSVSDFIRVLVYRTAMLSTRAPNAASRSSAISRSRKSA